MSVPERTAEQRQAALERALVVRRERAALRLALKSSAVTGGEVLLAGSDRDDWASLRVRWLLESLPGIGPIRAESLMASLSIAPSRRVGALGVGQRHALVEAITR